MSETTSAEATPDHGPATVIIGHHVKSGRGHEYRRWQDTINAAVATFRGYLGTEATAPTDESDDSTVIYRFDTVGHLHDWLNSPIREQLLAQGADFFDRAPAQHVVVGGNDNAKVATVVVSHVVNPDDEEEFLRWRQHVNDAERRFPGFCGSELFRPIPGVQDNWTIVYRFSTSETLDRWLESDVRKELLRQGEHFRDFELRKITNSFGSWFSFKGYDLATKAPPGWKTALSVLVGLYPTTFFLTQVITELWKTAKIWQSLLLGDLLSVTLLTFVVMPVVTRALRFWLAPDDGAEQPRTDVLGVFVSLAVLTACAFVFWLISAQLFSLP